MFDTIINKKHETVVTPVTRIIEKSISPDKVTEMYDKVKEELESRLMRSFVIHSSRCDFAVSIFEEPLRTDKRMVVRFEINGEETILEIYLSDDVLVSVLERNYNRIFEILHEAFLDKFLGKAISFTVKEIFTKP